MKDSAAGGMNPIAVLSEACRRTRGVRTGSAGGLPSPAGAGPAIRRGIMIAEGDYIACQTFMEGTFVREFTQSPAGLLRPNGQRVVWDLLNMFRFDDQRRLVEESVRTDYRSFLRQLGAPGQ